MIARQQKFLLPFFLDKPVVACYYNGSYITFVILRGEQYAAKN